MLKHVSQAIKVAVKMAYDIVKGSIVLFRCKKQVITIFGGHLVQDGSKVAIDAYAFGKRVIGCNYAVVTGGGAGVMKFVNQGAFEHKIAQSDRVSFSVLVQGVDETHRNEYVDVAVEASTFFARKFLLI